MRQICSQTTLLILTVGYRYPSGVKLVPVCSLPIGTDRILETDGNWADGNNDGSTGSNLKSIWKSKVENA